MFLFVIFQPMKNLIYSYQTIVCQDPYSVRIQENTDQTFKIQIQTFHAVVNENIVAYKKTTFKIKS